eukprot:420936_1
MQNTTVIFNKAKAKQQPNEPICQIQVDIGLTFGIIRSVSLNYAKKHITQDAIRQYQRYDEAAGQWKIDNFFMVLVRKNQNIEVGQVIRCRFRRSDQGQKKTGISFCCSHMEYPLMAKDGHVLAHVAFGQNDNVIISEFHFHETLISVIIYAVEEFRYDPKAGSIHMSMYGSCMSGQSRVKKLKKSIAFKSFHVSCRSDRINGEDMTGIVLYQYDGKTDWRLKGVHCKSGYIILKLSDNIKDIKNKQGIVHGKCYKSVFGMDIEHDKVIGGGFSFEGGKWKFNSGQFNDKAKRKGFKMEFNEDHKVDEKEMNDNEIDDLPQNALAEECERFEQWDDDNNRKSWKIMHPMEQQCILAAIRNWKKVTQNTIIKNIRGSYDGYCKDHECFWYKKNYNSKIKHVIH